MTNKFYLQIAKHSWLLLLPLLFSCSTPDGNTKYEDAPFRQVAVSEKLQDGYWLESADFDADGDADLIGYGLTMGLITLYVNPGAEELNGEDPALWESRLIKELKQPVGMDHADVDQDGLMDVVICYEYGETQKTCLRDGGKIIWMKNPGPENKGEWEDRYIGQTMAMHRLRFGKFTQNENLELLALPVVGDSGDIHTIIPIYYYEKPEQVLEVDRWPRTLIDSSFFEIIHDAFIVKNPALSDFDVALIASQQGISWLYYGRDQKWHIDNIAKGATSLEDYENTEDWFTGTNTACPGKIGENPFAYIAALEPFHGGIVSTYQHNPASWEWDRFVLHKYGEIDEQGYGVGHFVITQDLDGDQNEEFLVAFPRPPKGVLYVKPLDLEQNLYDTLRVSGESAARITIDDYNLDGKPDFATIGYNVPGYYEDPSPRVLVFLNNEPPLTAKKEE
ncbi:hypothetical protein AAG747_00245 [Rapidithrix thailandica]|uniref:Aldos-2-ulose dehydratase beta-propeller domain-containing protein n=1 Tax=Rapidithrix thailandica TaxID=413964 RepID=A0AAW9S1R7_9BACT